MARRCCGCDREDVLVFAIDGALVCEECQARDRAERRPYPYRPFWLRAEEARQRERYNRMVEGWRTRNR